MGEQAKQLYVVTVRVRDGRTRSYAYDTRLLREESADAAIDRSLAHFRRVSTDPQYGNRQNYSARRLEVAPARSV